MPIDSFQNFITLLVIICVFLSFSPNGVNCFMNENKISILDETLTNLPFNITQQRKFKECLINKNEELHLTPNLKSSKEIFFKDNFLGNWQQRWTNSKKSGKFVVQDGSLKTTGCSILCN